MHALYRFSGNAGTSPIISEIANPVSFTKSNGGELKPPYEPLHHRLVAFLPHKEEQPRG